MTIYIVYNDNSIMTQKMQSNEKMSFTVQTLSYHCWLSVECKTLVFILKNMKIIQDGRTI